MFEGSARIGGSSSLLQSTIAVRHSSINCVPPPGCSHQLARHQDLVVLQAGQGAQAPHRISRKKRNISRMRIGTPITANPQPVSLATPALVLGPRIRRSADDLVTERVEGQEEVHHGADEERGREDDGAGKEQLAVGLMHIVGFNLLRNALEVEELRAVDEGVEQRGLRPVRGQDRDAEDERDGRLLDPEERRGVRLDGAVRIPEIEGEFRRSGGPR